MFVFKNFRAKWWLFCGLPCIFILSRDLFYCEYFHSPYLARKEKKNKKTRKNTHITLYCDFRFHSQKWWWHFNTKLGYFACLEAVLWFKLAPILESLFSIHFIILQNVLNNIITFNTYHYEYRSESS